MRFNLNIFHIVVVIVLLFYGYFLIQPDAFLDEQDEFIDLGPYPTVASPILLPNKPTITIIIKPYCPTLTPLAADANSSEEYLRLHTRCRAGDWMYMSPTPTPTIDTTKRDLSTRIPCPSMTPLPVDASERAIQSRKLTYCIDGTWRNIGVRGQFDGALLDRTPVATRTPMSFMDQTARYLQTLEPRQQTGFTRFVAYLVSKHGEAIFAAIGFAFVALLFILKWTARFLSAFFGYLSRFAEYLLNLFDKNKE